MAGGGVDRPAPLRGSARISLQVRLRYRLDQTDDGWGVQIAAYQYALLDQREQEIVAYHWHPDGQSHVVTPHLHLGAGAMIGREELLAAHLPTGLIPLSFVVRVAVEAFRAEPSRRRWDASWEPSWSARLRRRRAPRPAADALPLAGSRCG